MEGLLLFLNICYLQLYVVFLEMQKDFCIVSVCNVQLVSLLTVYLQ